MIKSLFKAESLLSRTKEFHAFAKRFPWNFLCHRRILLKSWLKPNFWSVSLSLSKYITIYHWQWWSNDGDGGQTTKKRELFAALRVDDDDNTGQEMTILIKTYDYFPDRGLVKKLQFWLKFMIFFPDRGCPAAALRVWPGESNEETPIGNHHHSIIHVLSLSLS